MDGFEQRAERKKAAIRAAATELFSRYGVSKVSVREIAATAGVSQVSVYNYFTSKAGLIRSVVEAIVSDRITASRAIIESEQAFPEKLRGIILLKSEGAELLQGDFLESLLRHSPETADILENVFGAEIQGLMDQLFSQGKQSGHIDPAISEAALNVYMNIFRSGTREWISTAAPPDTVLFQDVITMFFRGMAPASPPPKD